MSLNTRTSGQRRYLTTNSAQTDFTTVSPALANGRRGDITRVDGELYVLYAAALSSTGSPNWKVQQLGPYRGARIQIFGTGASSNNTVPNYRIWTFRAVLPLTAIRPEPDLSAAVAGELSGFCYGTATIGTGAGSTNDQVTASEFMADAITATLCTNATTPAGKADTYETAYGLGAMTVYSPADNTSAELVIPDFGGGVTGFIIEFDLVANVTGLNAIVELTR